MEKNKLHICNRINHNSECDDCDHKYPHYPKHIEDAMGVYCDDTCGSNKCSCIKYKKGMEKLWIKN